MEQEYSVPKQSWSASIDSSGRILIPVELRNALDVETGDSLLWVQDDNGLHLKSYEETIKEIQDYYCSLSPPEDIWSEELIRQRRIEAENE